MTIEEIKNEAIHAGGPISAIPLDDELDKVVIGNDEYYLRKFIGWYTYMLVGSPGALPILTTKQVMRPKTETELNQAVNLIKAWLVGWNKTASDGNGELPVKLTDDNIKAMNPYHAVILLNRMVVLEAAMAPFRGEPKSGEQD
jgi:hypothetical protein